MFVFLFISIFNSLSVIIVTLLCCTECVATEPMGTVCGTQLKSNCVCLTGSTVNPYMSKGSYCSGACVCFFVPGGGLGGYVLLLAIVCLCA